MCKNLWTHWLKRVQKKVNFHIIRYLSRILNRKCCKILRWERLEICFPPWLLVLGEIGIFMRIPYPGQSHFKVNIVTTERSLETECQTFYSESLSNWKRYDHLGQVLTDDVWKETVLLYQDGFQLPAKLLNHVRAEMFWIISANKLHSKHKKGRFRLFMNWCKKVRNVCRTILIVVKSRLETMSTTTFESTLLAETQEAATASKKRCFFKWENNLSQLIWPRFGHMTFARKMRILSDTTAP